MNSNAVLKYAKKGLQVFPCGGDDGKKPLTNHGFKDATVDENKIREWGKKWPDANIGVPTGGLRPCRMSL